MSFSRNIEAKRDVSSLVKKVKGLCKEACFLIENNVETREQITSENIDEKSINYVRGLHAEIEDIHNTSITTDINLLTSRFLSEMEATNSEAKELIAYTQGRIADVDGEINRLNNQIQVAEKALSRPRNKKQEVTQENVIEARECFLSFKERLNGLIDSLFPDKAEDMKMVLGLLLAEKLKESNEYVALTTDNLSVIELLREINIIKVNPYNTMEVKLSY